MLKRIGKWVGSRFERLSVAATRGAGSTLGFGVALAGLLVWAAAGPVVGFSQTWQLVVNTSTTIVTFLMVFLIQRSQNKEGRAMQLKLDELVRALSGASNRMIDIESLPEAELAQLHRQFQEALAKRTRSMA